MEFIDAVAVLPFKWTGIKIPSTRLRLPRVSLPSAMAVFGMVLLTYFVVVSGVIYDVIMSPPSIGQVPDGRGGYKPATIMEGRMNGQYIMEGLSAGLLFILGAVGFILLHEAERKFTSDKNRMILFVVGLLFVVVAYNLSIVFLRKKVPGYLHSSAF